MDVKFISILVFASHTFLSDAICPSGHNVYIGKDIRGDNSLGFKAGKLEDCCRLCAEVSGCVAYVYSNSNDSGERCYLKQTVTNIVDSANRCDILGIMDEGRCNQGTHAVHYGLDIGGDDQGKLASVGGKLEECCKKCSENAACVAFMWSWKGDNVCHLKKSVGPLVENKDPVSVLYVKQGMQFIELQGVHK